MKAMMNEIAEKLKSGRDILIITHERPDGDTLGSAYALYYALRDLGKRVCVACSSEVPEKYPPMLGGRPVTAPDFEPSLILAVDVASEGLFGDALMPYSSRVDISIDHHPSNTKFAKLNLVDDTAAATGEIIYRLFPLLGTKLTREIAVCLFISISTDTGGFHFSNTTAETLRIASELYESGADFGEINKVLFLEKSRRQVELERIAYDHMDFYRNDTVAAITITLEDLDRVQATSDDTETLSNIPRYIKGVETGIAIKEVDAGAWKISVRSNGTINVSQVCAQFGGGGHVRAAGCTMYGSAGEVRERFVNAVITAYGD